MTFFDRVLFLSQRYEKPISSLGYLLVAVIVICLYTFMSMSGEDVLQSNVFHTKDFFTILVDTYHYIPRIGEFFQKIVIVHFDYLAEPKWNYIFRLFDAAIVWFFVYIISWLCIARKPQSKYMDVSFFIAIFIILMLSQYNNLFMAGFSHIHNYGLSLLISALFVTPYLMGSEIREQKNNWCKTISMVVLGFCFGIAFELSPVVFLILVLGNFFFIRNYKKNKSKVPLLLIFGVIGVILGLIFFYLGAGLGARTEGGYAKVYDYLSPQRILNNNWLWSVSAFADHARYNLRYLFYVFPITAILAVAGYALKNKEGGFKKNLWWQINILSFMVVYFSATTLILVHDDLYPRFMAPIFISFIISCLSFINTIVSLTKVKLEIWFVTFLMTFGLGAVVGFDLYSSFNRHHENLKIEFDRVQSLPEGESYCLSLDRLSYLDMKPSPIFKFKQQRFYEPWANHETYGREVVYSEQCTPK